MRIVEIKKSDVIVNLEVNLEELGSFICGLGRTSEAEMRTSAEFNKVKMVKDNYGLYLKLKQVYAEASK